MQHQRVAHGKAATQNGNMAQSGRRMAHGTERRRSVGRLHRDHMRSAGGPGRFQKKPTCSTAELEATAPVTACKPYTECDEYPSSEALHTYFFECRVAQIKDFHFPQSKLENFGAYLLFPQLEWGKISRWANYLINQLFCNGFLA